MQLVGGRLDFTLQSKFVQLRLELLILNFLVSHNLFQQVDIVLEFEYLLLLLISPLLCLLLTVHFLVRLNSRLLAGCLVANRSNIVLDCCIAGLMVGERVMMRLERRCLIREQYHALVAVGLLPRVYCVNLRERWRSFTHLLLVIVILELPVVNFLALRCRQKRLKHF